MDQQQLAARSQLAERPFRDRCSHLCLSTSCTLVKLKDLTCSLLLLCLCCCHHGQSVGRGRLSFAECMRIFLRIDSLFTNVQATSSCKQVAVEGTALAVSHIGNVHSMLSTPCDILPRHHVRMLEAPPAPRICWGEDMDREEPSMHHGEGGGRGIFTCINNMLNGELGILSDVGLANTSEGTVRRSV